MPEYDILFCVVNSGRGSKVLKIARSMGIAGGTIFFGVGTAGSKLLGMLDLDDINKEIVFMVARRETVLATAQKLDKDIALWKRSHGIAFIIPTGSFFGSKASGEFLRKSDGMVKDCMYSAIFTVVDRGLGSDVVDAAKEAGARGATIIHARGSGIHETKMVFAMQIEPEKDVVFVLTKNESRDGIVSAIREKLKIDEQGTGIVFTLDVSNAYGLY